MKFLLALAAIFCTTFANASYHYKDEPTTLKKGSSRYHIGQLAVALENNRKLWTTDATVASYPDQAAIQEMIMGDLRKQLEAGGIYVGTATESEASIDVQVSYRRSFAVGKGVTYPLVSFTLSAKDGQGQELASYQSAEGLLQSGGRKSMVEDQKIMFGKYDQEEEREDIAAVANLIYEAIANIGQ
jgi:hypothetical protein